jgi:nicotinamidase-related amidase
MIGGYIMSLALVLIDIQNIYFTEGTYKLSNPEKAAENAAKLLHFFRKKKLPIIHIKHLFDSKGYQEPVDYLREFHQSVTPMQGETVIDKHYPSSFLGTTLEDVLKSYGINELVIAGMMSHMCIDTTVRAAQDYGYRVTLIEDACTTKSLTYHDEVISADLVHNVFMAALQPNFAKVTTTETFIEL